MPTRVAFAEAPRPIRSLECAQKLLERSFDFGRGSVQLFESARDESQVRGFAREAPALRCQVEAYASRVVGIDATSHEPLLLAAVRKRFGQWILDTASASYDQAWLDYQHDIGLRHHRVKKNKTDGVSSVDHIHFRYLPALFYPIVATLKPFLEASGASREDVEGMHQAWMKSVLLQVILWSYPYVPDGDF